MQPPFGTLAIDPAADWAIRIPLALLLGVAALQKIGAFAAFRRTVDAYRILPPALVGTFAVMLVALEKIAAVGLLIAPLRVPFAALAAGLFGVYAVAIGVNLVRGRSDIDCGCGASAAGGGLHPGLLLRNAVLIVAAAAAALPVSGRSLGAIDFVTIFGGLAAAALLYQATNSLLAVAARSQAFRRREIA